jgi:hypothetical protein
VRVWWANGLLCGLLVGYLWWKLPSHVHLLRDRKARRIRADIDRIQGGFATRLYTPLLPPPLSFRERVVERFQALREDWRESPRPRTPEQVAEMAYQEAIRR